MSTAADTFPFHYRDHAGPCPWSGVERGDRTTCPKGCAGSQHHYTDDGHDDCSGQAEAWRRRHGACPEGAHDRSAPEGNDPSDDGDGQPVDADGLIVCRECGEPVMFCAVTETYDHARPSAPSCFLIDPE